MDEANIGNELNTNTAQKINSLHESSAALLNQSLEKAIEIGGILSAKKAELPTGEFDTWTKNNFTFTDNTTQRYLKIFKESEKELWRGFKY